MKLRALKLAPAFRTTHFGLPQRKSFIARGEYLEGRRLLTAAEVSLIDATNFDDRQLANDLVFAHKDSSPLQRDYSDFVATPANLLDTSFGGTGIVRTSLSTLNDVASALAALPDGKLLVAGSMSTRDYQFGMLIRYDALGTLDSSFGTVLFYRDYPSTIADIVVQSDGSIIAVGSAKVGGDFQFAIARYSSSGLPDTTFGAGGRVTFSVGSGVSRATCVAVQADGKIVVAGYDNSDFLMVRLLNDGHLDGTFGTDGIVTTDFGDRDSAADVAIASDEKIVVVGSSGSGVGDDDNQDTAFALARYGIDGSLDTAFGANGKTLTHFDGFDNLATTLAFQNNGDLIVGGFFFDVSAPSRMAVARYSSNGHFDETFGDAGYVFSGGELFALDTLPDGTILAAGSAGNVIEVLRLTPQGLLDETFGIEGRWSASIGTGLSQLWALAPLPDGRIVAAGYASFEQTRSDVIAVRLLPPVFAEVAGQHVVYSGSAFGDDDSAIATDKFALFPGGTPTFANYTSYVHGINGIVLDFVNLRLPANVSASDFAFRVGNDNSVANWSEIPPSSVTVRLGAGIAGTDRVTIRWTDGTIVNQWLQVTVRVTTTTGLQSPYVFYFGNSVGDSGDSPTRTSVNATDEIAARGHATTGSTALIDNHFDYNRDGFVDTADELLARTHHTTLATALRLIRPPSSFAALAAPAAISNDDETIADDNAANRAIAVAAGNSSPVLTLVSTTLAQLSAQSAPSIFDEIERSRATSRAPLIPVRIAEVPSSVARPWPVEFDSVEFWCDEIVAELADGQP